MGRRRLEKKLSGLLRRSEEVHRERTEPRLSLRRLNDPELELLDRLLGKKLQRRGELDDPEEHIWLVALLAKGIGSRGWIPDHLPPAPEVEVPSGSTGRTTGVTSIAGDPRSGITPPHLLERGEEEGETESST